MFKNKKTVIFFIAFIVAILPITVSAALPTLVPECARQATLGAPPLSCFLELGVNITNWILGVTGSLALLFFIYGGFLFLTSAGKEQQITKGKEILTQAAIGIIIIFGAYIGIKFIVSALGASKYFKTEFEITQPIEPKIPAPTVPTVPTAPPPPPTGSNCVCIMSTSKSFIGFKEQGEFQKDVFLSKICQDALQGVYKQDTDTCNPGANTPLAKGCISFSVKKDADDVKFSCSFK